MVENKTKTTIDDLIKKSSIKIGIDEPTVRKCFGAILAFLKLHSRRFTAVCEKIDGVDELIAEADADETVPVTSKPSAPAASTDESSPAEPASSSTTEGTTTTTATPSSSGSSIFSLIVTILKIFGVFAFLKQLLTSIFGESATKLIESIEDGAELTQVLSSLKINREQGIRLLRMLMDFMKESGDQEAIDGLVNDVPAVRALMSESNKEKED